MKRHHTIFYIKYFHVFGYRCFVLNDREHIEKFSPKAEEAKFIGYSSTSKAYRVFILKSRHILKGVNVSFDDSFQANYEQINSGLNLHEDCSEWISDIHHLFYEMYDDGVPSKSTHRVSEAEISIEPTSIALSSP